MCTIEACDGPLILYHQSSAWAQHEESHTEPSRPSQCLFCSAICQDRAYFKHVSAHLREVSLSVLPQHTDEDGDSDSDNEWDFSPTPNRHQEHKEAKTSETPLEDLVGHMDQVVLELDQAEQPPPPKRTRIVKDPDKTAKVRELKCCCRCKILKIMVDS